MKRPISVNVMNQLNTPPETTPLQKVFIIFGMGIFIALACVTAGLPINYPSHLPNSLPTQGEGSSYTIDVGDTAWMVIATAFATLAAPLLTYLLANLYGRVTSFSVQVTLLAGSLISLLWIVITFSLTYAKDANGDQILGLPKYLYMFAHTYAEPDSFYAPTIPFSIFAIFELSYPILAAAIVVSALIDRVNVYGLITFLFIWHVCLYTPIAHITWNERGFFYTNYVEDYAGGLVVFMTAGITAITGHVFLDWIQAPKPEPRKPHNPESALFAAIGLWFLWFGVNAGKAVSADAVACQTIVNTIAGVTTSILVHYYWDWFENIRANPITITNSILVGIVSTAPSSGFVTVGGAMCIAVFTTLVTRVFGKYWWKETLENTPYSVGILFGIGGSTAFLFTALLSYQFINPDAVNGLTHGMSTLIRHHTAAILAMWACGFVANFLAFLISNLIVPLSKDKQAPSSPKGEYAPAPLGPYAKDSEHHISTNNLEEPPAETA